MAHDSSDQGGGLSRRRLLASSAAAGHGLAAARAGPAGQRDAATAPPPGFPAGSRSTSASTRTGPARSAPTSCGPAHRAARRRCSTSSTGRTGPAGRYARRAVGRLGTPHGGRRHTRRDPASCCDTTAHLTAMSLEQQAADGSAAVRVQAGATLEACSRTRGPADTGSPRRLHPATGRSAARSPSAPRHGRARGRREPVARPRLRLAEQPGHQLTAVVRDGRRTLRPADLRPGRGRQRRLPRPPRPGLPHRGGAAGRRRPAAALVSLLDIPASELFARPGTAGGTRTFASFVDHTAGPRRSGSPSPTTPG